MHKIKLFNNIAERGLSHFAPEHYQINAELNEADAFLLRSHSLHEEPLPEQLLAVARAGVGVNNIPVDKMTQLGIPVLNTPGANANAVKELVIAGMLIASRNICRAWDFACQMEEQGEALHKRVEKEKKRFAGRELAGKRLGVVGLGAIGVKIANAALALGMEVIGYDPFITIENCWQLSSEVKEVKKLDQLLRRCDFISLHVPLNDKTRHLISQSQLQAMKPGVTLLNFSRDAIVDVAALITALEEKQVGNYVCDFPHEQFKDHSQVIALPHLGASTGEAEENCAVMAVQQLKLYLEQGHIKNSVNFPSVSLPGDIGNRLAVVNSNIPNMVSQITGVLAEKSLNIVELVNQSRGDIAYTLLELDQCPDDEAVAAIHAIPGVIRTRRING
ncbi:MAG: phosphoglycerate dehydrogenase [Gammaproteobacteria bacterium]|nr:phosphoglycerate dehydrogenase [Gammaproteobacteria bacterium]MCP4474113.1 phosphoglycerate dehydrogenase [Gammaproteobacteria bacterium]